VSREKRTSIIVDAHLNEWSLRLIKEADSQQPPNYHTGFFRIPLQRYRLRTGMLVEEAIQGRTLPPTHFFLALKVDGCWILKSLWPGEWFDQDGLCWDTDCNPATPVLKYLTRK